MGNQEQIFAGQEQQYPNPRNSNNDPREQWQESPPQEMYMYPGIEQRGGEKLRPPLRPRRRGLGSIIAIIIGILLVLGLLNVFFLHRASSSRIGTQTLFVGTGASTLLINNNNGSVHIHKGDSGEVVVRVKNHNNGMGSNPDDMPVSAVKDPNSNSISINTQVNRGASFLAFESVDLDISVPQQTNIKQLQDGSGSIDIEGISGRINAQSDSGSIDVHDLSGQIRLHTGRGDIDAEDVKGQLDFSTGSGSVDVKHANLSGSSTLHTGSDSIKFEGAFDPKGTYQFDTGSGSINLKLPSTSAFHLEAQAGSGSVVNEFDSTDVGSNPRATLTLRTGSGSIHIHKSES